MAPSGSASSFPSGSAKLPWPSRAVPNPIQLPHLTSVLISTTDSVFGVYGWLKHVSRGGITALTSVSVPIRSPLEIAVAGCLPVRGEASYSLKRSRVHQIGVWFSSQPNPNLKIGDAATVYALDVPFIAGSGSVLDTGSDRISILCKEVIRPGAWVRIEAKSWILFGAVKDLLPIGMVDRCMEIHLEAAFHSAATGVSRRTAQFHWWPPPDVKQIRRTMIHD